MIYLCIDPGRVCGVARLSYDSYSAGKPRLESYGIIPQTEPGKDALIVAVKRFLDRQKRALAEKPWTLIYEAGITSHEVHQDEWTSQIRGVIVSWAMDNGVKAVPYTPSTIKAMVCCLNETGAKKTKKDVKNGVTRLIGFDWLPQYMDHCYDAIAVGLCHAIQCGWKPSGFNPRRNDKAGVLADRVAAKFAEARG